MHGRPQSLEGQAVLLDIDAGRTRYLDMLYITQRWSLSFDVGLAIDWN